MKKEFMICLTILFTLCIYNNTSYCFNNNNDFQNVLHINNINDKDIKVEITNMEIINSAIV